MRQAAILSRQVSKGFTVQGVALVGILVLAALPTSA
jgi:hypothetical protein